MEQHVNAPALVEYKSSSEQFVPYPLCRVLFNINSIRVKCSL